MHSWDIGGDGSIRTADVVRSMRLGVERFELTGSSFEENADTSRFRMTRFRTPPCPLPRGPWLLLCPQSIGQRQPENAQASHLKQFAAAKPLAAPGRDLADRQHGNSPLFATTYRVHSKRKPSAGWQPILSCRYWRSQHNRRRCQGERHSAILGT